VTQLRGGEQVIIVHDGQPVHTFERTMSDALLDHVVKEDPPGGFIDLWRLITPIPRKHERKLDKSRPLIELDSSDSPETRLGKIVKRQKEIAHRRRMNRLIRDAKFHDYVDEDTVVEKYRLGFGIPEVSDFKLWSILDQLVRETGRRKNQIGTTELTRRIRARRTH
jgi:hypothetical protein